MELIEARSVHRVVRVREDPVLYFVSRVGEDGAAHVQSQLRMFFAWLNRQDGWVSVTPRQLLIRQLQAEDEYEVADLIQGYLDSRHDLRMGSKKQALRVIRSFFRKNRCSLPADAEFTVRSDLIPAPDKLSVKEVRAGVLGLPPLWQSLFAVKYMSFSDTKRLVWMGRHATDQIVQQVRAGEIPIRVDLPCGRKKNANDRQGMYFTYFGRDAAEALKRYFTEVRGWPGPGEPIWVYEKTGKPVTRKNTGHRWLRTMRHLGFVPKMGHLKNLRYGYNTHEMRDVATTQVHVNAKSQGFDMDCVKFFCGQVGSIDRNKYDKFYKEQDYVRNQYLIAEPHLNIISNQQTTSPESDERIKNLEKQITEFGQALDALRSGKLKVGK